MPVKPIEGVSVPRQILLPSMSTSLCLSNTMANLVTTDAPAERRARSQRRFR